MQTVIVLVPVIHEQPEEVFSNEDLKSFKIYEVHVKKSNHCKKYIPQ